MGKFLEIHPLQSIALNKQSIIATKFIKKKLTKTHIPALTHTINPSQQHLTYLNRSQHTQIAHACDKFNKSQAFQASHQIRKKHEIQHVLLPKFFTPHVIC